MILQIIQDFCKVLQRNKISLILDIPCIIIYYAKKVVKVYAKGKYKEWKN